MTTLRGTTAVLALALAGCGAAAHEQVAGLPQPEPLAARRSPPPPRAETRPPATRPVRRAQRARAPRVRFRSRPVALPAAGGASVSGSSVPAGGAGPRTLIVIGDSLALGMAGPLRAALPGWRVSVDGRIGRPLGEGLRLLAELPDTPRGAVLAFSLFTNDAPGQVEALDAAVRASVARAGPSGCAVWATIRRPPLRGVGYVAANRRLDGLAADPGLARHLRIVRWNEASAGRTDWIARDGVHATPAGYAARARLYAAAARSCAR